METADFIAPKFTESGLRCVSVSEGLVIVYTGKGKGKTTALFRNRLTFGGPWE